MGDGGASSTVGALDAMEDPDSIATLVAAGNPPSTWARLGVFWIVAVLLLAFMLTLIPLIDNGSAAVPDDGVYAAQALALADGSWSQLRPAADIDSDGFNSAVSPSFVYADRQIPYLRHPLFPIVLGRFYAVAGFAGLVAVSVLGVWIAAVAAGLMTRRLNPSLGVIALLLTALGTPLVFDAYLVSAHGIAAGLFGLFALGIAQTADSRRWWPLLYALPCAGLLVNVRSEGLLAVVAVGAVTFLLAIHPRHRPQIDRHSAGAAAMIVVVAAIAFVTDIKWTQSIKASTGAAEQSLVLSVVDKRDPLAVAWVSLIRPWYGDGQSAQPLLVLSVVCIVLAGVALRIAPRRWLLPVGLVVLSAGCLTYLQLAQPSLVTGLFAAFPLLIAGLVLLSRDQLGQDLVKRNLGAAALATVAITALTYEAGGAIEWGGRFYHLLIPALVPIVVLGLHRGYRLLPANAGRIAFVAVVVGATSLSVIGVRYARDGRRVSRTSVDAAVEFALRHGQSASGTTMPLIIVSPLEADGTGRMFWRPSSTVEVLAAAGLPDLFPTIALAKESGRSSVTVLTNVPPTNVSIVGKKWFDRLGWNVQKAEPILGTPFGLIQIGPDDDAGR